MAILHPRCLCVYSVTAFGGWGIHAQYYSLTQKYCHNLDRNAYNFICGSFGQQNGLGYNSMQNASSSIMNDNMSINNNNNNNNRKADSICVQSVDGKFWIFEQESYLFSRDWNNFVIPGCMQYVTETDCLLMMNSDMKLYCYKYVMLSTNINQQGQSNNTSTMSINNGISRTDGTNNMVANDASPKNKNKSVHKTWSLNVGDHGMQISVTRFRHQLALNDRDIILLCEKSIFSLSLDGIIQWQHKLDYNPSCMSVYPINNINRNDQPIYNLIIGSFQNSLHIYSNCKLIWSARLAFSPIDISVASISYVKSFVQKKVRYVVCKFAFLT